jgi:hypothetical protein
MHEQALYHGLYSDADGRPLQHLFDSLLATSTTMVIVALILVLLGIVWLLIAELKRSRAIAYKPKPAARQLPSASYEYLSIKPDSIN